MGTNSQKPKESENKASNECNWRVTNAITEADRAREKLFSFKEYSCFENKIKGILLIILFVFCVGLLIFLGNAILHPIGEGEDNLVSLSLFLTFIIFALVSYIGDLRHKVKILENLKREEEEHWRIKKQKEWEELEKKTAQWKKEDDEYDQKHSTLNNP